MESFNKSAFESLFQSVEKIVIISHKNPDGDAIGSSLGLKRIFENFNKKVTVLVPDSVPLYLSYLSDFESIKTYNDHPNECKEALQNAHLIALLDFNTLSRIEELGEIVKTLKTPQLLIDHHPQPETDITFLYHTTQISSTCELVYKFGSEVLGKHSIDSVAATALLTGLVTDTGSFRYNVFPSTFKVAAQLIEEGGDHKTVIYNIFDRSSVDRMRLNGYAIAHKLTVLADKKIAYIGLSRQELNDFKFKKGDTEGLVNQALSIDGVFMACLMLEIEPGLVKYSFRSLGENDVNILARTYFNGGGHKNAAGGTFKGNLEDAEKLFLQNIPEIIGY